METLFNEVFGTTGLMPHGHCYLWQTNLVALHIVSDGLIALSYFSIPVALTVFVRRRGDLAFGWVFYMFAAFILACGTTHLFGIWTLWNPDYGIEGVIKLATAGISVATAVALWPLIPKALRLPSPAQLEAANAELASTNTELQALATELEDRVAQRTAALARSNQELERFAYVASHDLKEPLTTAGGFLQLLDRRAADALGAENRELLGRAVGATHRMQELIDRLLEYSRVGRADLAAEAVEPAAVARRVAADMEAQLREAGGRLEVEESVPVLADAVQLERVLRNLVSNAIKYRSDAPLVVAVSAVRENGRVTVRVRDNGIGIAPEHHERVFEMFQRLHSRAEVSGTGMGLAIARRTVEAMGGTMWVESAPGEGSTFAFTLAPAEN